MTPFLLTAEESYTNLSGYFVDKRAKELFQVEVYRNKILIKAQNSRRYGWNTYYRVRGNKFRDGHGNLIYIKNSKKLYWKSRRGHNKKILKRLKKSHFKKRKGHDCDIEGCFYPENHRQHDDDWYRHGSYYEGGYGYDEAWGNNDNYYDDWDRYDRDRDYYDRGRNNNRNDDRYNERNNRGNRQNTYGCGGEWSMVGSGERVNIRLINDGLEANAPSRGNEWTTYKKSMISDNYFWDNDGNAYVLQKDGTLEWRHRFGIKKHTFKRI